MPVIYTLQLVDILGISINDLGDMKGTWQSTESSVDDGPWFHVRLAWTPDDNSTGEGQVEFKTSWCTELTP